MVPPCLPWRKLLSLAELPGAGRAATASGGSSGRCEPFVRSSYLEPEPAEPLPDPLPDPELGEAGTVAGFLNAASSKFLATFQS